MIITKENDTGVETYRLVQTDDFAENAKNKWRPNMTQLQLFRDNPFQTGSQNYRLLERLRRGPVTNEEIIRQMNIFNSTGRTSDLRNRGFDVEGRDLGNGLWEFELK